MVTTPHTHTHLYIHTSITHICILCEGVMYLHALRYSWHVLLHGDIVPSKDMLSSLQLGYQIFSAWNTIFLAWFAARRYSWHILLHGDLLGMFCCIHM